MSDRSRNLAGQLIQQTHDFVSLLTGLTPAQLNTPCRGEKEGDTVGIMAARTAAIYDRMAAILGAVASGAPIRPGVRSGPQRPGGGGPDRSGPRRGEIATEADADALLQRLTERGQAAADQLRRLSAEQLSRSLPAGAEVFEHVDKPIGMIVEYLLYCQADRYELMSAAVAVVRTSQSRQRSCGKVATRRREQLHPSAGYGRRPVPASAVGEEERS